jgi:hypothetical protein
MAKKTKRAATTRATAKSVRAVATVSIQSTAVTPEAAAKRKLPRGIVTMGPKSELAINVEQLNRSLVRDQRAGLVSSMGCVSNPGGPGC